MEPPEWSEIPVQCEPISEKMISSGGWVIYAHMWIKMNFALIVIMRQIIEED